MSMPRSLAQTLFACSLMLALVSTAKAQLPPGSEFPAASELSDQKLGSILIYNYYTSDIANPNTTNTTISLANAHAMTAVAVRLFFVRGNNGSVANIVIPLAPKAVATFLAGDADPGMTGFIVAVAISPTTGCPISHNYLMGDADIKLSTGQRASLGTQAFSALTANPATCSGGLATLNFDGVSYNRLPRILQLSNLVSTSDGNSTRLVVNHIGGSLAATVSPLGTLFGLLYDDAESVFSYTFNSSTAAQFVNTLSNSFPQTSPPFNNIIGPGRTGWSKFYNNGSNEAYLGAALNFNSNSGSSASAFNNGNNLHVATLVSSIALPMPVAAPANFANLAISKSHSGNFTVGAMGTYTITVSNAAGAGAATGPIIVKDVLPGTLTLASFSGTGWSCTGAVSVTCTHSSGLNGGASLPPLMLTVNVPAGTPLGSLTNRATVTTPLPQETVLSNNAASDPTMITDYLVFTDFTGGIPPTWTVGHNGTGTYPGNTPATWTASNPCNRVIPAPFSGAFAIVDASCANPGATFNERLSTPPFNASGLGTVYVEFYNRFLGATAPNNIGDLEVSLDGGVSWLSTPVQRFQGVNEGFPTPTTRSFNISPLIAANRTNVRASFHYYTGGASASEPRQRSKPVPKSPTQGGEVYWAFDFAIYSYAINPTSQNFTASGGTGSVNVSTSAVVPAPQGVWTATSNAPWIMVTSGNGGTGNGTVNYSIAANTGPARNGTVTIAGNTFTVTQSAAPLYITSVIPPAGRTSGGQLIKLAGSFAGISSITMGGLNVATWSYTNGTSEVTLTTPAHVAGAVDIVLTPTAGSPYTKTNAFAYLPKVFTDDTLVPGVTIAKAQHVLELRQAVEALRIVAGLGAASWTDPTLTPTSTVIKAVHITELRSNLETAATTLGYSPMNYTDPVLNSNVPIKRIHIEELRQRIRNIAG